MYYFACTWLTSTLESLYLRVCEVNLDAHHTTDIISHLGFSAETSQTSASNQALCFPWLIFYLQVFYKETFTLTSSTGHQPIYPLLLALGSHQPYQIRVLCGYVAYHVNWKPFWPLPPSPYINVYANPLVHTVSRNPLFCFLQIQYYTAEHRQPHGLMATHLTFGKNHSQVIQKTIRSSA